MSKYSKQFAVVNRIKAFVRLTGRKIRNRNKLNDISEDIARKIQRSAYDVSQSIKAEEYTPPYKAIAKQLQVHDEHIYSAAIHSLSEIAKNNMQYHEDIVKIFTQQLKDNAVPQDLKSYIQAKLDNM